jgi:hypothetical protein
MQEIKREDVLGRNGAFVKDKLPSWLYRRV